MSQWVPEAADDDLQPERPAAKPLVSAGIDQVVIRQAQQRVDEIVRGSPARLGNERRTEGREGTIGGLGRVVDGGEFRRHFVPQDRVETSNLLAFELGVVGNSRCRCPALRVAGIVMA